MIKTLSICTGKENQGICRWCGGQLPKRRTAYCCEEHSKEYNRHFEWLTASNWALRRYGHRCADCGKVTSLQVHHIIPLNGGTRYYTALNCPCNLIPLCLECHVCWHNRFKKVISREQSAQFELALSQEVEQGEMSLPKPYYSDEQTTIYCGDCREILPLLPDKSIDLVLTDPPYQVSHDIDDVMDFGVFSLIFPKMKEGTGIACFCGQASLGLFMVELGRLGLTWLNTIIWHYDNTIPRERHRFVISYDPILFYSKGVLQYFDANAVRVGYKSTERLKHPVFKNGKAWYPNANGALRKDVWDIPAITSPAYTDEKVTHKWQKPIEVLQPIIEATSRRDDILLDPFLGSGTTAVAAKQLGRKCIGIEIEEKYCEIAVKRLAQSIMPLSLPDPEPVQKVMEEM